MSNEQLAGVVLALYTLLIVVAAFTTAARIVYLKRNRQTLPVLLVRDVIVKSGLAFTFLAIAFVRAVPELVPIVRGQVWWTLLTSIPAIFSAATYVYFEIAVIGKPPKGTAIALESSVRENIELTHEAIEHAAAAYHEANNVNVKIARLTEIVAGKEDKA